MTKRPRTRFSVIVEDGAGTAQIIYNRATDGAHAAKLARHLVSLRLEDAAPRYSPLELSKRLSKVTARFVFAGHVRPV